MSANRDETAKLIRELQRLIARLRTVVPNEAALGELIVKLWRDIKLKEIRKLPLEKQLEAAFDLGIEIGREQATVKKKRGRKRNARPEDKVLQLLAKGHSLRQACFLAVKDKAKAETLRRNLTAECSAKAWKTMAREWYG